jgi:hypothetical protein
MRPVPPSRLMHPMRSQDHFIDLLVSGQKNTLGGLCYNGSCNMMDNYPYNGEHNFLGWNLFGDASLQLRTAEPETISFSIASSTEVNSTSLVIHANRPSVRVGLSWAGEVIASGFTNIDGYVTLLLSTPLQSGYTYYLTATAFNCLPATSSFTCQTEGEGYLNVADIAYNDNDDGVINPEEVIFLQITVHNPSQVDVADVYIWFNNLSDYIDFSWGLLHLGNIAAGSDKQVGNYLRISRDCPDYRNLQYELVLSSNGQSWKTPCMITVHTPVVSIVDCKLLPEKNWLNPGEEFQVQYKIANTGSGALKDTRCELVTDKDWLSITRPIQTNLSCPSNDSLLVTYTIRIDNVAQADSLFNLAFELTPANAPDKSCAENHLVLPENVMMEGFETNDNVSFLWEFPQGNTWQNDTDAYEGRYSFKTPQIDDNATTSAELKLELEQEGYMSFRYKVQSASTQYYLQLYVNDTPTIHCSSSVEWSTGECILYPGVNVLSWRFTGQGANDDSTACAWIDAIQFPRGTIFNDAQLMTDVTEINLTIHPEQVIYSPVYLTSADGRYVDYTAVLQKVAKSNPKSTNPSMVFNRDSIFPGTVDRYIVTLYNPLPDRELREVRLHIPAGIIVTGCLFLNIIALALRYHYGSNTVNDRNATVMVLKMRTVMLLREEDRNATVP